MDAVGIGNVGGVAAGERRMKEQSMMFVAFCIWSRRVKIVAVEGIEGVFQP